MYDFAKRNIGRSTQNLFSNVTYYYKIFKTASKVKTSRLIVICQGIDVQVRLTHIYIAM